MPKLLADLGFQTLRAFLSDYMSVELPEIVDHVYVKTNETPKITSFLNTLKTIELIKMAIKMLLSKDPDNHMCMGCTSSTSFESNGKVTYGMPNTSLNIFKSHEWNRLLRIMGDELMLFLLTKCSMVQVVGGNHVFLAGNFRDLYRMPEKTEGCLDRNMMFHKRTGKIQLCPQEAFNHIFSFHNPDKYKVIQDDVRSILENMQGYWKRLFLPSIFSSYFEDRLLMKSEFDIMRHSVEPLELVNFLFLVSRKLFKDVFDAHAFRIFKSKLSVLVHRNRYEAVSRNELIKYFKISSFKFFRSSKCNRYEFVFRSKVVSRFLNYVMDSLFIPIISKYFYSTETSFSRFKVHYFPRTVWQHVSSIHTKTFLRNFERIRDGKVDTYSETRCIPKNCGVRVVMNMSKSRGKKKSVNNIVYPEFCVLREESKDMLENSVLGYSGIYKRLVPYLMECKDPLYILKLDLSDCFDNIPQDGMTELVKSLFKKDRYYVKTLSILEKVDGELKYRQIHKINSELRPMNALMKDLQFSENNIVKEGANQRVLFRERMEDRVNRLIKRNVVKYDGKFFLQRKGIAQGSVLSTLLCSLYYDSIDKLHFNKIFKRGLLVRYVDDFLIATPSVDEIVDFLNTSRSVSHLGINFSMKKITSNFGVERYLSASFDVNKVIENKNKLSITNSPVVWCGSKIYSRGFSIKPHVADPYFPFSMAHNPIKPGKALISKMKNLLRKKTSPLYINPNNCRRYENIYDVFFFYGKKLVFFVRRMDFINRLFVEKLLGHSRDFIHRICKERKISITKNKIWDIASSGFRDSGITDLISLQQSMDQ